MLTKYQPTLFSRCTVSNAHCTPVISGFNADFYDTSIECNYNILYSLIYDTIYIYSLFVVFFVEGNNERKKEFKIVRSVGPPGLRLIPEVTSHFTFNGSLYSG